jgi:hypothetical protein
MIGSIIALVIVVGLVFTLIRWSTANHPVATAIVVAAVVVDEIARKHQDSDT